jgi:hypothetical protein
VQDLIELEIDNCIVQIINSPALEISAFIEKHGTNKASTGQANTHWSA